MRTLLAAGLMLAFVGSIGLNGYFIYKAKQANIPAKILDGDTFQLPDGDRVRLLGVNAPETGRCGSAEAAAELSKLISGKSVRIEEEKRDTYGRRMGLVYVGSTLVNQSMLSAGWARPRIISLS
jgi:endonuclease YncB( thermonuclease family)